MNGPVPSGASVESPLAALVKTREACVATCSAAYVWTALCAFYSAATRNNAQRGVMCVWTALNVVTCVQQQTDWQGVAKSNNLLQCWQRETASLIPLANNFEYVEYFDCRHVLQKSLLFVEIRSLRQRIRGFLGQTSPHSKRHFDRFIRFFFIEDFAQARGEWCEEGAPRLQYAWNVAR